MVVHLYTKMYYKYVFNNENQSFISHIEFLHINYKNGTLKGKQKDVCPYNK